MRIAPALAACALLASCAEQPPAPVHESTAPPVAPGAATPVVARSNADELVSYLARIRTLSESALGAEAARMKRESSDLARVKAALALSLSPQSDEQDILDLVDATARKTSADRDVRAMATLLHAMASERKRLKQRAAAAAGELREERRAVETQKQRAEALQQKLDALTDLEKSLANRDTQAR